MPDPIDVSRLREFSDGTPDGVRQLVAMFLAHVGETFEELRGAIGQARADDIRSLAHRAAGAAGACGAVELARLLAIIETHGTEQQVGGTPALMDQADAELARVRTFLAVFVDDHEESNEASADRRG